MATFPQRFVGYAGFHSNTQTPEIHAIRRSKTELVVEFQLDLWRYTANLTSEDGIDFFGAYIANRGGGVDQGHVTASLYTASCRQILFGVWHEGGESYSWWVQLEPVEEFE